MSLIYVILSLIHLQPIAISLVSIVKLASRVVASAKRTHTVCTPPWEEKSVYTILKQRGRGQWC